MQEVSSYCHVQASKVSDQSAMTLFSLSEDRGFRTSHGKIIFVARVLFSQLSVKRQVINDGTHLLCTECILSLLFMQGRVPAHVDKQTVKELVQKQIEAAKPIRVPWYRRGPKEPKPTKAKGTGGFIPAYAEVRNVFCLLDMQNEDDLPNDS
jgi:hypothetical protein